MISFAQFRSLMRAFFLRARRLPGENAGEYQVFTNEFDKEVLAEDLLKSSTAYGTKNDIYEKYSSLRTGIQEWMLQQNISSLNASARIRTNVDKDSLNDFVISILIDHSGSMRGQRILLAAAAVEVATDFLLNLGVKVEVLGFTTSSWRGGLSRLLWKIAGKPGNPGRLCDLLHVIYREADEKFRGSLRNLALMLQEDFLKENVDGEAIQWAATRLRSRPEHRKILIVLTDGAPVDDSTLAVNRGTYLLNHLVHVLTDEQKAGEIVIAGVGICYSPLYATPIPYGHWVDVETPSDLGRALIGLLEKVIAGTSPLLGSQERGPLG